MIKCFSGVWTGVGVEKIGWGYDYLWRRLGGDMIMCLSGVWIVGVEKVGWKYDYVFIWYLDRSWCGEG